MAADTPVASVPLAGNIISVILSMATIAILAVCLMRRIQPIQKWTGLPLATWLIIIIYIDSTLFVFVTAVISRGFGINTSRQICEGAILLCLACYMTTKIIIYYFLVEKAYIIRGSRFPRMKTKLWLFNCFGMILPYAVIVIMNFVFRIAYINTDGVCIIGMEKISMMPLIIFDVVINVYMTLLFLIPLRRLYSYQHNTNDKLRIMAFRTFIGSIATLVSSVANLTVLMVLKGEPGWICLMLCNADIMFCVLVLHWVTQIDTPTNSSSSNSNQNGSKSNPNGSHANHGSGRAQRESLQMWPGKSEAETKSKKLQGTITTECMGVKHPSGRESQDSIVEMHKISVRTEQVQEIEIDSRSDSSRTGVSAFEERGVSVEKMV